MSPRPYRRTRQAATEQTRARIIEAARDLLMDPADALSFSIDAIARRADVARMTVYYQFKSKRGLLEALFDDLAARAKISELRNVFREPDPLRALDAFIDAFIFFWTSGRLVIRRVNALAGLDPEIQQALDERQSWRREGLATLVARLTNAQDDALIDTLQMLTGFATFDMLAAPERKPHEVASIVKTLARAVIYSPQTPRTS